MRCRDHPPTSAPAAPCRCRCPSRSAACCTRTCPGRRSRWEGQRGLVGVFVWCWGGSKPLAAGAWLHKNFTAAHPASAKLQRRTDGCPAPLTHFRHTPMCAVGRQRRQLARPAVPAGAHSLHAPDRQGTVGGGVEQLVLPTPHSLAAAGGPAAADAAWQPLQASWSTCANRSRRQRAGATPSFGLGGCQRAAVPLASL